MQASVAPAAPLPGSSASVTVCVPAVALPPASATTTTGWTAHAVPPVPPPGSVSKTRRAAGPVSTLNGGLTASEAPPPASVAVTSYEVPARSMVQPVKAARPDTLVRVVPPLHANVPPASLRVSVSVITRPLVVTVLPPASWSATTGCVAQGRPPVPPPGCRREAEADGGAGAHRERTRTTTVARPAELAARV